LRHTDWDTSKIFALPSSDSCHSKTPLSLMSTWFLLGSLQGLCIFSQDKYDGSIAYPLFYFPVCLLALGLFLLPHKMNEPPGISMRAPRCATTGQILSFVASAVPGIFFVVLVCAIVTRLSIL
jgi:hypothetical protein